MTARWVVDEVAPNRDLNITWQPISLLLKNNPPEDSDYFAPAKFTHNLLRVMESVRSSGDTPAEGNADWFSLYWELGSRIHHDKDRSFTAAEALAATGLAPKHAEAFDDEAWDAEIRTRMDAGLDLTGDDVGTPIIALDDVNGDRVALFGPVITRAPQRELALQLWDGFVAMAQVPGFWEVKRTRTESPDFGDRP